MQNNTENYGVYISSECQVCFIIRFYFFWLSVFGGQAVKSLRAWIKRQANNNFTHKQAQIKVWSRSLTGLTRLHIVKGIKSKPASDVKIMSTPRTFAEHTLQTNPNPCGRTNCWWSWIRFNEQTDLLLNSVSLRGCVENRTPPSWMSLLLWPLCLFVFSPLYFSMETRFRRQWECFVVVVDGVVM